MGRLRKAADFLDGWTQQIALPNMPRRCAPTTFIRSGLTVAPQNPVRERSRNSTVQLFQLLNPTPSCVSRLGIWHLVKSELKALGIPAEVRKRIQSHRSKTATSDMDDWYDHADHYDEDYAALALWEKRQAGAGQADRKSSLSRAGFYAAAAEYLAFNNDCSWRAP